MTRMGLILHIALALVGAASLAGASGQTDDSEQLEALSRLGREFSSHLVRVRVQQTFDVVRVDGVKIRTEIIPIGFRTGLILTNEPLILTPASASMLPPRLSPGQRVARPQNLSEVQYLLVLKDGSTRKAEVTGRIDTLNLLQLRLADPSDVPEELRHPLPLKSARRPVGGEWLGIVMFRQPTEGPHVDTLHFQFQKDREQYSRPIIMGSSLGHIGCPVLTTDGALAGILNAFPADREGAVEPDDLIAGAARDPLAQRAGTRFLSLMTGGEVEQVLGPIVSRYETAVPYELLGIRLHVSGASLRVHSLIEEREDGLLLAGDLIRALSGTPVASLEEFDLALEEGLEQDQGRITLEVERQGETVTVSLTP
ncbi:MAG: hypothetical protein V2A76_16955 [Planctomycetota bacterium]